MKRYLTQKELEAALNEVVEELGEGRERDSLRREIYLSNRQTQSMLSTVIRQIRNIFQCFLNIATTGTSSSLTAIGDLLSRFVLQVNNLISCSSVTDVSILITCIMTYLTPTNLITMALVKMKLTIILLLTCVLSSVVLTDSLRREIYLSNRQAQSMLSLVIRQIRNIFQCFFNIATTGTSSSLTAIGDLLSRFVLQINNLISCSSLTDVSVLITFAYNDKQEVIDNHVNAILNLNSIYKESHIRLRQLIDNLENNMS
ncbi:hypothetical protein RN001_010071 [Aquatica leii]|uniref:Uncharacterized protein n=1 Tax=Aquatica leii TaxID=1421715 RepID=A0AAN7Q2Y4_9COLE|nr:hypothetical protein RN001_010071 [Aquatica leii]